MPNWCTNIIKLELSCSTIEKFSNGIEWLEELGYYIYQESLNNYISRTDHIDIEDRYGENIRLWGTKWDIIEGDYSFSSNREKLTINMEITYSTAWSPNLPVTKKLYSILCSKFNVELFLHNYYEFGHRFYGTYDGDTDTNRCYEMSDVYFCLESYPEHNLESLENGIIKLKDIDSLFIIKSERKEVQKYYEEIHEISIYKCFSETFGEDITVFKHNDLFYSEEIYI